MNYPVVIGIDFGTTYSGCSYAFAQNEEIIDIVKWPKQNNHIYPKTPTLSLYRKGSKEILDWGHGAKRNAMKPNHPDTLLLSKFKLYLDEHLQKNVLPNNLDVVDVIADYLSVFHQHVCEELQKGFAANYQQSSFRYCLTVPAMWSDQAKSAMREAAIRAGLVERNDPSDRLMLISEPEAAALYCEKKSEQFNLMHGQRFMICDAGGGTVDLIVFEINEEAPGRRTLREVTRGHGDTCGSGFLDIRMRDYIRRKCMHISPIHEYAMEHILDNFINMIKPEFDGLEDQFLELPACMGIHHLTDQSIGLSNGCLHLPATELLNEVFEPIVQQILRLIEYQLQQSPDLEAILLVGGFGQSNYLFRRIDECFADRVGMIGVPPRGELAVVRGAVYFGLHPTTITERVSRRTYGIETRMLFQPAIDPPDFLVTGVDGRDYCRQRFSVYVYRGQSVKVDACVSKSFVISYPNNTDSDLYAFDGDGPVPRLTTDPQIQKVGHFPIRMPKLEGVKPGDKVTLTIRMYFGLTEIKIESVILDQVITYTSAFESAKMGVSNPASRIRLGSWSPPLLTDHVVTHPSAVMYPSINDSHHTEMHSTSTFFISNPLWKEQ
ncbi:Heat shock protein 12B [Choanephora cucurbitarum]|uniref:Heat shock protein 12B n=1 Tax=Choanephora cucurbitarum TaxID=101091 RepID=A0A1C7NT78_9FUNG|nr:Heat shock protein 12B [Choanephora cucurbitarum]